MTTWTTLADVRVGVKFHDVRCVVARCGERYRVTLTEHLGPAQGYDEGHYEARVVGQGETLDEAVRLAVSRAHTAGMDRGLVAQAASQAAAAAEDAVAEAEDAPGGVWWRPTTYHDDEAEHEAIVVPWEAVREILGREHRGTGADDAALVQSLLDDGAPSWVADCEGWVDERGWGLIGPRKEP